jgi:hypothetical protein
MSDGWSAEAGPDPAETTREIARARDEFLRGDSGDSGDSDVSGVTGGTGGTAVRAALRAVRDAGVRPVVAESWRRSASAHVDPALAAPVTLTGADLAHYRAAHPLSLVIGLLRELVGAVAEDGRHLMAVSDSGGRLLWVEGHAGARRRAETMNFVEGAVWDEAHAGTNAPGTALALDHAVQIFSAEHFRPAVQPWTCAAAPIHDPFSGRILGVVDVTGGDIVAHPHSLALVSAAARAAEAELGARLGAAAGGWRRENGCELWLPGYCEPAQSTTMRLTALGRDQAVLRRGGVQTRLNRRHSEVLVILALHPEGVTGDQLVSALYDADAAEATVRVEVARLRRVLGDVLRSRPYRLAAPLTADFLDVAAAVRARDAPRALAAYGGSLLPRSEAPAVVAERHWLDVRTRTVVLESADRVLLEDWLDRFGTEDLEAWEHLAGLLPPSVRRSEARAEARRLRGPGDPPTHATLR